MNANPDAAPKEAGDLLLEQGKLTEQQLDQVRRRQPGKRLGAFGRTQRHNGRDRFPGPGKLGLRLFHDKKEPAQVALE